MRAEFDLEKQGLVRELQELEFRREQVAEDRLRIERKPQSGHSARKQQWPCVNKLREV